MTDASLPAYKTLGQHSISGLSSGAFMTVQLHVAHSASFIGAGVVAGGPYRCVQSFRGAALGAEDACMLNAFYIAMTPLTAATAPRGAVLADWARQTPNIDPVDNIAGARLYIFTGTKDTVVNQLAVRATRDFYLAMDVPEENILFVDNVPAGHSLITNNPDDSPLGANQPPYLNRWDEPGHAPLSHDILRHIYQDLAPPAERALGALLRFEQTPFISKGAARACMAASGYVYVPSSVLAGETARGVHIALHGCKQGSTYVNFVNGLPDRLNQPPYGTRYVTTTGYNEMAEANKLIVLYPQAIGDDNNEAQNPDGCWDWWGYSAANQDDPDFYTRHAVQISAIHAMLRQLSGEVPAAAAGRELVA